MIERKDRHKITRRSFVAGAGLAAAAGPFVWTRRASAAGKVIVRPADKPDLGGLETAVFR